MFTLSLLRDNQQGACCGFRPRSMSEFIYGVRVISATLPRSFRISTMRQYSVTVCHLQGVLPVWLCSGQDLERDAILITFAVPLHPKHDCSLDRNSQNSQIYEVFFPRNRLSNLATGGLCQWSFVDREMSKHSCLGESTSFGTGSLGSEFHRRYCLFKSWCASRLQPTEV